MTETRTAIVSGGMDSVTLAHLLAELHPEDPLVIVSVNYGQRHVRELQCAAAAANRLGAEWVPLDLSEVLRPILTGSALTDDVDVPEGHYAEDTMKATIVPNRNAILLAIATGLTTARGGGTVYTGVHAGDHFVYPDCRPAFIEAMSEAMHLGTEGDAETGIAAPFEDMTKAEIVSMGDTLGVPFDLTWSCYQGGNLHCGVCGTCTERREAFEIAGVPDPTTYVDLTKHWVSA